MYETEEDLDALQSLLDRSYARAGDHLANIHTDKVRLRADEVAGRLQGMSVAVVSTVTSDGRPLAGPVDAFFVRGTWWFSTAATAVRTRHLRARPAVSLALAEGEELVVVAHGVVEEGDPSSLDPDYRRACVEQYGSEWIDSWGDDIAVFRVRADRLFAADMSRHRDGG